MQHYIIDFVNTATEEDISAYLNSFGGSITKRFNAFEKVVLVESSVVPPEDALVEHIKNDMDDTNHIKLLTTVPIQYPTLPTEGSKTVDISDQKNWWKVYSGSSVNLEDTSFQLPLSGAGAVVYLLDSGIKSDHPDFQGADIEYLYSLTEDFTDRKGHGTALASVIVGNSCGITNAKLKVVKLFDTEVPTKLSDFLGALDAVYTDFTAINAYGVMNCSWSIARNEYIESKMQTIFRAGVQIVVAAGNDNSDIGNVTPAAMPESIVVGAYNASLLPCDFSNYTGTSAISVTSGSTNGGALSGWAPGENIHIATLNGEFGIAGGTSIAAAIHSAIIAYNVTLPAYQFDDSINAVWNDATRNNISYFSKKGLLILDDPKYANSPNLVSLLITDITDPYNNIGAQPELFAAFYTGGLCRITLFNPMTVSSVTVHDALPHGLVINNYGILSGYVASIEGEQEVYQVSLTVTDIEGNTSDGQLEIKIVTLLPEKTPPSINPNVPYELNNNCATIACSGGFPSECDAGTCTGFLDCYCGGKGFCECSF
jgi:subtilisin family serine protease